MKGKDNTIHQRSSFAILQIPETSVNGQNVSSIFLFMYNLFLVDSNWSKKEVQNFKNVKDREMQTSLYV
ncbi:hypothetical protein D1164_02255 [Mariniphaga sediminis]|uniref:Uncharacterized protein n=1 Tax=Mariniphaga sediminis TaxID=1628158 RepID=A0A399D727_9BACT|nr:hypothetical protein D1164_02255 [Mariniphaga sediminis]